MPWDRRRVVHLHRRTAFAATWEEIERDLGDGPSSSIDRLLAGKARRGAEQSRLQQTIDGLADAAVASRDPNRLKAWWVYRMLLGPDPLGERLTLMWHNHFATSNAKVDNLAAMRQQNETLRRLARARFGDLLTALMHDPALLRWLDADSSRKRHPNENLGRELMELFTLGVGHYTEKDVKEAARALTGWSLSNDVFHEDPSEHDDGDKVILGHKGRWRGMDLVQMLLEHPATARRLAWRICELLMGEGTVSDAGLDELADGLRRHELDIGWAVQTVLRSAAFFAPANLGTRVLGPVEYVIGVARALELSEPPPSTLVLADWIARLGQDLFYPPNVGGWTSGRGWISAHTLIARSNFAAAVVDGGLSLDGEPLPVLRLAKQHGQGERWDAVITFYCRLLLGSSPEAGWRDKLLESLGRPRQDDPQTLRRAVALILASPAVQLA
jgi:uncharacterized protein (DUF1800 family)